MAVPLYASVSLSLLRVFKWLSELMVVKCLTQSESSDDGVGDPDGGGESDADGVFSDFVVTVYLLSHVFLF